jgi:hypothetical protein
MLDIEGVLSDLPGTANISARLHENMSLLH